ncbi:hypothetical protein HPT27_17730 [Permianibacter sp. IMCC34836]|uniref:hypothetical protein n=1 Tax=Permianibacter fluminis TaxID=2738515 RepID=UPI00155447CC|nr:hypothetical protein [Permianibacter fluminis]NQD38860.1 hypothetical protein [Permianibacter fluminis]
MQESIPSASIDKSIPFAWWKPVAIGAVYGLLMRLLFMIKLPFINASFDVMGPAFLFGVPLIVGALTVFWAKPDQQRSWLYCFLVPWASVSLFVCGTAVALIEGSICIAMALPLFVVLGSVGGLLMMAVLRFWQPGSGAISCLGVLPILCAIGEQFVGPPDVVDTTSASVYIEAPAAVVWQQLNNAEAIQPSEVESGLAFRIGVPLPVEGITVTEADGLVRKSKWQKGVAFDEPILISDEHKTLKWAYRFAKDSFPSNALDEHVEIGGRYFDLRNTTFALYPESSGVRLVILTEYRISTHFNWYSNFWAQLLLEDFSEVILQYYKRRSERTSNDNPVVAGM